jgi:fluoride exporter
MRPDLRVVAAVGIGGSVGATARYELSQLWPEPAGQGFPWTTFAVNITGCFAIGVLVAALAELTAPHPLARPLLGTGFLGGYTTLSTYAEQTRALIANGESAVAAAYVFGTLVAALVAVWLGMLVVRIAAEQRRRRR